MKKQNKITNIMSILVALLLVCMNLVTAVDPNTNVSVTPIIIDTGCSDSDGIDYYKIGTATKYDSTGIKYYTDYCRALNTGGTGDYVNEFSCQADGSITDSMYKCSNGCSNGACISGQTTGDTCTDSGDNFYVKDKVTIYKQNGEIYNTEDACLSDGRVQEQICCNSEDYLGSKNFCAKYLQCLNGCSNGACIIEQSTTIKISSVWTDKSVYYTGEQVKFYAKVIDSDGTTATPEEGTTAKLIIESSPTNGANGESTGLNYNYNSQYYEYTAEPIKSTDTTAAGIWTFSAKAAKGQQTAYSNKNSFTIKQGGVNCPSYSPLGPNFCIDGTIVSGGVDKNGCQLPPSCKPKECTQQGNACCKGNKCTAVSVGILCTTGTTRVFYGCDSNCMAQWGCEGKAKTMPPFIIAVAEGSPSSDVIMITKVSAELNNLGYGPIPAKSTRLFGEVNAFKLDNQVTLAIFNGQAQIIVGSSSPTSYVIFANDITEILKSMGADVKPTLVSSDIKSSNLKDLFVTSEKECQAVFSHCSCSMVCMEITPNEPRTDCARACPFQEATYIPECGYVNGVCKDVRTNNGKSDLVIGNLAFSRTATDMATIEFDVKNNGNSDTEGQFTAAVYINNRIYTHTLFWTSIKAGALEHKSLSNYYWINDNDYTIIVVADRLDKNDPNFGVWNNQGFTDNAIKESNEDNNKAEILIKGETYGKYVTLNQKFGLVEGQSAKVTDYGYMKLIHKGWMCAAVSCATDTANCKSTCSISLTIDMPAECKGVTECTSTAKDIILGEGKSAESFGTKFSYLAKQGNEAILLVQKSEQNAMVDVELIPVEQSISYGESATYTIRVTDKHNQIQCISAPCDQPMYTYFIEVRNLPFQKEYMKQVTLTAGETQKINLLVTPYEQVEGSSSNAVAVEDTAVATQPAVESSTETVAKVTSSGVSTSKKVEIEPIVTNLYRTYKFNVKVMQKNEPQNQDIAYGTLVIEPKVPPPIPSFPGEQVKIKLYPGWNLVSLPGKLVSFDKINLDKKLIGFVYLKDQQRYVNLNEAAQILGNQFTEYLARNSFWVYSYKEIELSVNVDRAISYNDIELKKGWNLVPITEDMIGGYLIDIKGDCGFEKLAFWDPSKQDWQKIDETIQFPKQTANYGFLIKEKEDCRLGGVIATSAPPAMPE